MDASVTWETKEAGVKFPYCLYLVAITFVLSIVSQLCRKFHAEGHWTKDVTAPSDHWKLGELAKELGIPPATLNTWRRRGWVRADQDGGHWVLRADDKELQRLRQLADHDRIGLQPTPSHLTTPKVR